MSITDESVSTKSVILPRSSFEVFIALSDRNAVVCPLKAFAITPDTTLMNFLDIMSIPIIANARQSPDRASTVSLFIKAPTSASRSSRQPMINLTAPFL